MGSEWSIIIQSSFCGILPWQAGGKVTRRPLGRKLLGKYLTVFSHWHWLSYSISDYNTPVHYHVSPVSTTVVISPAPRIIFVFPRISQPSEMFYFNSAVKLIWQWCWVTSLISYHLSVRLFTLTWWKYFNYKWENHHLLFVTEHFAK